MSEITIQQYKPSEVIAIFNDILSRQNVQTGGKLVCIRGIYIAKPANLQWAYCYDILHDETTQDELTICVTHKQRENLTNGNLVDVFGTLGRKITNKSQIQLQLNVSRVDIIKNLVIDEIEVKRIEIRHQKTTKGFQNVDAILEQILYKDERPHIALIFAATSITLADFTAGINAGKSAIDFKEYRVSFANPVELSNCLRRVDAMQYSTIALVRGGVNSTDSLDDPIVLETIVSLKTPIISAIGHVEEKLFIKQIVDKVVSTPNGLGQYFSELVETISEKKTKSRAFLTEQIKRQFQQQLESGQKQNKELQEKLSKFNETQIKLQEQLKKQQDDSNKRISELTVSIKKMQETNANLQKSLSQLTVQHTKTTKEIAIAQSRTIELENLLNDTKNKEKKYKWYIILLAVSLVIVILFVFYFYNKYGYLI
ncbi:MAG: exonuclease VII large subunit [Prevotellaceae bacterium]|nr:exonuclease VII large subunit [Prevotellaceae bacterium]